MQPPPANWILCEAFHRWMRAIRAAIRFGKQASLLERFLLQTESLDETWALLEASPTSLVTFEVEANHFARSLLWIAEARRSFPHAVLTVLLSNIDDQELLQECSLACREAGARQTVANIWELDKLLSLANQHFKDSDHVEYLVDTDYFRSP